MTATNTTKPAIVTGKYAIERSAPGNSNSFWPPTTTKFRGRWEHMRTPLTGSDAYLEFIQVCGGVILGACAEIDCDNRELRIYDPYTRPENKDKWEKLKAAYAKMQESRGGLDRIELVPDFVVRNASHDQIKQWLYWARRWFDAGKAIMVHGHGLSSELPAMETICAMPGKINENPYGETHPKPVFIHDVPVPVG